MSKRTLRRLRVFHPIMNSPSPPLPDRRRSRAECPWRQLAHRRVDFEAAASPRKKRRACRDTSEGVREDKTRLCKSLKLAKWFRKWSTSTAPETVCGADKIDITIPVGQWNTPQSRRFKKIVFRHRSHHKSIDKCPAAFSLPSETYSKSGCKKRRFRLLIPHTT